MSLGGTERDGLDYMFARKVLRKLESLNIPFLVEEIKELITLLQKMYGKTEFRYSVEYLEMLLRQI